MASEVPRSGIVSWRWLLPWAILIAAASSCPVVSFAQQKALPDKPFAEHRIVLQLSDRDPQKQALVISVANNLLAAYDPDKIAIEVVAFGPGIDLLGADSPQRKRVDSLVAQGVRFDVCMNTIETVERQTGHRPPLNPNAVPVQVGVGQILNLVENGFTLVRP
jgi:intracellular sulfur oxidation DsrE/DsrF family protein